MSTMTIEDVAKQLNGSEYGNEGNAKLFADMKRLGLVAVFGASDDLMEFRGAINDEVGCYDGGEAYVNEHGLCESKCSHGPDCPYFKMTLKASCKIEAVWCPKSPDCSWIYKTKIPHVTFDIMEDGELYCRGIAFRLADAKST